ncbi:MAG: tetratricopeptide (TPR) repeat protein [Myxococcota bacterium]|jgi:tetratricopeptide (TPR) repeat protein
MSGADSERGLARLDESAALFDALHIDHRSSQRSSERFTRAQLLLALGRFEEAEATIDTMVEGDRCRLQRGQAWLLAQVFLAGGRDAEALALAEQATEKEAGSREGRGAWAWGYTVRGLVRARLKMSGAAEDLRAALSVWEPRFTPRGRPAELLVALHAIEDD